MARAYVAVEFTDHNGKHEVNKEIDLPRTTPEEKANYDRLLDYGIISTSPVDTKKATAKADEKP